MKTAAVRALALPSKGHPPTAADAVMGEADADRSIQIGEVSNSHHSRGCKSILARERTVIGGNRVGLAIRQNEPAHCDRNRGAFVRALHTIPKLVHTALQGADPAVQIIDLSLESTDVARIEIRHGEIAIGIGRYECGWATLRRETRRRGDAGKRIGIGCRADSNLVCPCRRCA
jgi:hypothetical protein